VAQSDNIFIGTSGNVIHVDGTGATEWKNTDGPGENVGALEADSDKAVYALYEADPAVVWKIRSDGFKDWEFTLPSFGRDLTHDGNGNVYALSNPNLIKLDGADGSEVWSTSVKFTNVLEFLAADSSGIYVKTMDEDFHDHIEKYDHSGALQWDIENTSANFSRPILANGNLYVGVGSGTVKQLNKSDGSEVKSWSVADSAEQIDDIDASENAYAAKFEVFKKLKPDGTEAWSFTKSTEGFAGGVVDTDGHSYAADELETREFDTSGDVVWSRTGQTFFTHSVSIKPQSTNQAPTADFTFSKNGGTVDFTDQSSDPDGSISSWDWDFGDGTTSTQQNPTHTYSSSGTFTVTLTVTDDAGATDSTSQDVSVTVNTGSGSLTDGKETLNGSATLSTTGNGSLADQGESLSAAAALEIIGSGAFADGGETLSTSGTLVIEGSGALADGREALSGSATLVIVGSGEITDLGVQIQGTDEEQILITGSGSLSDRGEVINSSASLTIGGSGALADGREAVSSDATLPISGSGVLLDARTRIGKIRRLSSLNASLNNDDTLSSDTSLDNTLDLTVGL